MRWFFFAIVAATLAPARAAELVPGHVLVRYRSQEAAARRAASLTVGRTRFGRALTPAQHLLFTTPTQQATLALVDKLNRDPEVLWAEPDFIRHKMDEAAITPSDPYYPRQWALPLIRAPFGWSRTTGSATITVAVVDTGFVKHPELVERIVGGYNFISDPSNSGNGMGRSADATDYGDASDASSGLHGTHVAGIVGATSNNGVGVAGLDWQCRLLIARALGVNRGTGTDSDISDAIRWAAGLHVKNVPDNTHPAQVINLSFGGQGYSQTMQDAIHDAIGAGAIVVSAAGNSSYDATCPRTATAMCDSPAGLDGVIAVGAVDSTGKLTDYSNFGSVVAVLAPGGQPGSDPSTGLSFGVLSTIQTTTGFSYAEYAGTSQAAPFVAATVALMKSIFPTMDATTARRLIADSADHKKQCTNPNDPTQQACGGGLLDVDAALVAAQLAGGGARPGNELHSGYGCAMTARSPATGPLCMLVFSLACLCGRRRRA